MYHLVRKQYPSSQIWFTGHSLGGALAGLMSHRFRCPGVTFESPGEALFASRVGLSVTDYGHIYHFGIAQDPFFTGDCHGPFSFCALAGYAMETRCHGGNICVWEASSKATNTTSNVLTRQGYRAPQSFLYHRLERVLEFLRDKKRPVPRCIRAPPECRDCSRWTMLEHPTKRDVIVRNKV